MTIQLLQGDCLEHMKEIPDGSVDCAVIDPPYKIVAGGCRKVADNECSGIFNKRRDNKRTDWVDEVRTGKMFKHNDIKFSDWLPELFRVLKEKIHCYLMINSRNLKDLQVEAEKAGFKFQNLLIWDKGNVTPNRYYMQGFECILMLRKGGAKTINVRGSSNILRVPNIIGNKKHPSEKPVELLQIMIGNSTNEGDTVIDPFMGSGTTGVACVNTNRNFIGIEKDPQYFEIAKNRIAEAEQNKANSLFAGE
jgi:site-specific DNA-methyltransferase (adenine-specific)